MLARLIAALALVFAIPAAATPALWRVGEGRNAISLYGTIHALPPGTDWFGPKARAAFADADTLVVEVVMPENPAEMAGIIGQIGFLTQPEPLCGRISADRRAKCETMVKAVPQPAAAMLPVMKSWLASMTLLQLEMQRAGIDAGAGVDVTLTNRARHSGKQLVGLETARGQLELFNGLPPSAQALLLASAVDENGTAAKQMQGLVQAWLAGDAERIRKEFDDASLSPELEQTLFINRNRVWTDWIENALKTPGQRFMAVGAAHMAGPNSVIAMLKARGIKVERVE